MKIVSVQVLALLLAGAAHAQTAPPQTPPSGSDLTRDLNAGPPAQAVYLVPAPTPAPEPAAESPPSAPSPALAPPRAGPEPASPAPQPRTAPIPSPRVEPPAAAIPATAPETTAAPPPPTAPAVTVLDAAARAALPFSVDLPPGFEIITGRPGPDFRIYTIRRGDRSFAMVYAGPASQFPIYSGQMVEVGGRASVVSTENGVRHAQEHLFQRATPPLEVHIWTMSLDGADRALAEQIAQSLDVR